MKAQDQQLKKLIFAMCGKVEESLELAIQGLLKSDPNIFKRVYPLEEEINHLHLKVDEECLKYIALKQPVARELRFIISCLKINTDLERIGDQAKNIAQTSVHLIKNKIPLLPEIKEMTQEVLLMVHESLDGLIKNDLNLAYSIFRREKTVDLMKNTIFMKIISEFSHIKDLETSLEFVLISRNLEKIGDHAQNIAESLIFTEKGKDIRHSKILDGETNYEPPQT